MAKDPAFLFYTGDFSTGTQFFSDEQVGKYLRLLMAQHQLGHLEEKHMIMICKSYDKDVFSKFIKDSDGLFYNERLENEIFKRKNYCESRGNNKKGKKIISKSYDLHMEDKNKDINKIEYGVGNQRIKAKFIFDQKTNDGEWLDVTCMALSIPYSTKEKCNDYVKKKFHEFLLLQIPSNGLVRTIDDIAQHFVNWVRGEMTKDPEITKHRNVNKK